MKQLPKIQNEYQNIFDITSRKISQQKSINRLVKIVKNAPNDVRKQNRGRKQRLKQLTLSLIVILLILYVFSLSKITED